MKNLSLESIKSPKNKNMITKVEDGKKYIVVTANKNGIIKCPFCEKKHIHGKMSGHRRNHCDVKNNVYSIKVDGVVYLKEDGYIVDYPY